MFEQDEKQTRIQFACAALQGIIARGWGKLGNEYTFKESAKMAWELADEMMKQGGDRVKQDKRDNTGPM